MAVYLISDVTVRDTEAFEAYRIRAAPSIAAYGGRFGRLATVESFFDDGDTSAPDAARPLTTDTLMVRRGSHYFVKNSTTTGIADYDLLYGEPRDAVLGFQGPEPFHQMRQDDERK